MTQARIPPLLALALVCLLALAGLAPDARAQTRELSSSGQLLDSIVALVNDGVVLRSELQAETDEIVARLQKQGTQLPPPAVLQRQVLDRLIIEQLELQRAEKVGIKVSDETLNQALANIAERNNVPLAELPAVLAKEGVDYASYRRELRQQITIDQLRQRDVLQRIYVSPKEVDAYLARQEGKASLREEFLHLPHPHRRGGQCHAGADRGRGDARPMISTSACRRARISPSWPWPTPTASRPWKAAAWAGARAANCPPSSPTSRRA